MIEKETKPQTERLSIKQLTSMYSSKESRFLKDKVWWIKPDWKRLKKYDN